jgi:hypothetical protein
MRKRFNFQMPEFRSFDIDAIEKLQAVEFDDPYDRRRYYEAGDWNSSESGHPHIFANPDGNGYLFFQGNNDNGKTWFLSNVKIIWRNAKPEIEKWAAQYFS